MAGNKGNGSAGRFVGSLRDALSAASRAEEGRILTMAQAPQANAAAPKVIEGEKTVVATTVTGTHGTKATDGENAESPPPPLPRAAEAAREARGDTPNIPPVKADTLDAASPPTTRVVRSNETAIEQNDERTQLVRGRQTIERGAFRQDPVVGWLVIVGGPGIGSYRPIFEGNNTVGRASSSRIPIDFGDDAISGEEQAYIRYDSMDRSFLFVPNMSKTNVVSVNEKRPTTATPLRAMDVIAMGRTQLVFVPFCGPEFDWAELTNK